MRKNLSLRTGVTVTRIVVERGRAVGVEIVENGSASIVRADREVIVSAGAIGSPKLLMLSGIGPAQHLKDKGVSVVHDLPGVGQNLQDHMDVGVLAELSGPYGLDRYKKLRWQALAGLEYALFGKGPIASNLIEGGAFWWGDRTEKTPDIQFHFLPGAGLGPGRQWLHAQLLPFASAFARHRYAALGRPERSAGHRPQRICRSL